MSEDIVAGSRKGRGAAASRGSDTPANPHYVSTDPFDPNAIEAMTKDQEKVFLASQFKLMWWKFRKHKRSSFSSTARS
jgi:peptide/nickel transport system permease protein